MDKNTAKKVKLVVGVLVIILCIAVGFSAFSGFVSPYKSVSEVVANPSQYTNRQLQVSGWVIEDSVVWSRNMLTFEMTDGNAKMKVVYRGVPPSNFPSGKTSNQSRIDVVVIGSLMQQGEFKAVENGLLVKCPSKYEQRLDERKAKT